MASIENNLILVKDEDKTADIYHFEFLKGKPLILITYKGGKEYTYNSRDVKFFKNPTVHILKDEILLKNEIPCYGAKTVQYFENGYARIIYNHAHFELVNQSDIRLIDSALNDKKSRDCFDYYKEIAERIGIVVENKNILTEYYRRISYIRDDSICKAFLSHSLFEDSQYSSTIPVYPFGFNISQKNAIDTALNSKLSVIEGPPGTGKTQTILNIIANIVLAGGNVALVSSNNSATKNVLEKLEKNGIDFIAAYLGNMNNKYDFIKNQKLGITNLTEWSLDDAEIFKLQAELKNSYQELHNMLERKNKISELNEEYDTVSKEFEHYKDLKIYKDGIAITPSFNKKCTSDTIMKFIAEFELADTRKNPPKLFKAFLWKFRYKLKSLYFWTQDKDATICACQAEYYSRKRLELEEKISKLSNELEHYSFDAKMADYTEKSMKVLHAALAKHYAGRKHANSYELDDLWKKPEQFIKDYPVVLSTTYSLRSSLSNQFVYDYVIIDEASQVDLATAVLAFSCAKRAVVVGDLKQLPNVVTEEQKKITAEIFEKYEIESAYRFENHSILSSIVELFPNVPRTLLREHYRCNSEIIGFCNKRFYNNELIILTEPDRNNKQPLKVYKTVKGNHARNHYNQRQIDVIQQEVIPNENLNVNDDSLGIVTPYRNQANELQRAFEGKRVKADTADKFQGQERNTIIFSTVDNEISEFASDPNRLNVAVSRAKKQFIVVTDGNDNDDTSPIHDLIDYIMYQNHEVVDSKVSSIFDYLYKDYNKAREEVLKKHGRISDIDSENLMYQVIKDVLEDDKYNKYDVDKHIPLNMIINDYDSLNEREKQFAENRLTHVDFIIFSKLSHKPVLAVEVDGFKYHMANEIQIERDKVKNSVLEKNNIPIVRFSTVGSNEKEKLEEALSKIG